MYTEPKKLVEHGLASAVEESVGQRTRTIYTITEAGNQALQEWTETTAQPPVLEAEALLRLLFADSGTVEDLLTALDEMATDAAAMHEQVSLMMVGYLEGEHPFPDRMHLSVLFATFQLELFELIVRWVEFAKGEISTWPTTRGLGMTEQTEVILNGIKQQRAVLGSTKLP